MHSILVLGKEAKILFYIKYSMFTHVLVLLIKRMSIVQYLHLLCDALKVIWFDINSN